MGKKRTEDLVTTVVGALGGGVIGAEGAIEVFQDNQAGWFKLAAAFLFGVMGYFTNKTK